MILRKSSDGNAKSPRNSLRCLDFRRRRAAAPSSFCVAAAEIWKQRSGETQSVSVGIRHAVVGCRSTRYLRVAGKSRPPARDAIAGVYKTGDGRFVRLHTLAARGAAAPGMAGPLALSKF